MVFKVQLIMNVSVMAVFLISLCLVEVFGTDDADRPLVVTPSGTYRGHILQTRHGRDILAFQGIPYAQPPVGKLRFKEPVRLNRLEGIFDADDESKECYQPVFDLTKLQTQTEYRGEEDCLYLNIYTPKVNAVKNEKLPVYFWIHGGGYFMASGSTYYNGPEYLLDKNMILVTINYRLGVLGFLSTGDKVLPGNLGMKDQSMALKWVQENIESFGGDPHAVTLGGESAGSASVVQHMHSNLSKGLFHRAIAQSGTMDCVWAMKSRKEARNIAERFGSEVNCPIEREDFVECLQRQSIQDLFQSADAIKDPMGVMPMDFVPVIEDESPSAFLTASSVSSESDIPLVIGITNMESLSTPLFLSSYNEKYKEMSGILEDKEKLFPVIHYYSNDPNSDDITKQLVLFYFNDANNSKSQQLSLINLSGDVMFNYGTLQRARKHKGPTYLYMFSYKGNFMLSPGEHTHGVSHAEDLLYMFDFKFTPHGAMTGKDLDMSERFIQIWYDFIKTGDPTPDSKLWVESEGGVKYLDFTNNGLYMKSNMFNSRMLFLDQLKFNPISAKHDEL